MTMFIIVLITIARKWKSTDECTTKLCYTYRVEYYSTTKKNEVMELIGKWMALTAIILSEVSGTRKCISVTAHSTLNLL